MNILKEQLNLIIPANKATPSPPLGPALGQRGINIMKFCKEFNALTNAYNDSIPLNASINVYTNNEYKIIVRNPNIRKLLDNILRNKYRVIDIRYVYEIIHYIYGVNISSHLLQNKCKNLVHYLKGMKVKIV